MSADVDILVVDLFKQKPSAGKNPGVSQRYPCVSKDVLAL